VCCLGSSLLIAWQLLTAINYGYGFWYDQLQIDAHIQRFAPQNRQGKGGFETTPREQHEQLFADISHAVNHNGEGLRSLSYQPAGQDAQILLTDAEATHLEDVSKLISTLLPFGYLCLGMLVMLDDIFSALHVAVFPPENQWFFYYQDSLMTTLMKAPDIFFAIGAAWGLLSAILFALLAVLLRLLSKAAE